MDITTTTTNDEDRSCKDLIGEAFERAVSAAEETGCPSCGHRFPILGDLDLDTLGADICKILKI